MQQNTLKFEIVKNRKMVSKMPTEPFKMFKLSWSLEKLPSLVQATYWEWSEVQAMTGV